MFPPIFPASASRKISPTVRWRAALGVFVVGHLWCSGWTATAAAGDALAQERPRSVYLDLRPASLNALPQTTPAWVTSLDFIPAEANARLARVETPTLPAGAAETDIAASEALLVTALQASSEAKSVFRIRVAHPTGAANHLQVRIFFEDASRALRPRLTVRDAVGVELMRSPPLGQGLGLPSSESLLVPMVGSGSLEIAVPGDGSTVRGVFLTWVGTARVLQADDFPSDERVRQPFGALAAARTPLDDTYLYGAVTAGLQDDHPLVLKPAETPAATFQFELEQRPLFAVVTYEVLGATIGASPAVMVNGQTQGDSEIHLPDLSDPGFRGESEGGKARMSFRYTGWLRAQKVIQGDALTAGLNNLRVELSNGSEAVAIRSVSIQLKYNWEKLDYILSPAPVPYETH